MIEQFNSAPFVLKLKININTCGSTSPRQALVCNPMIKVISIYSYLKQIIIQLIQN